jgi:hypothetical protein
VPMSRSGAMPRSYRVWTIPAQATGRAGAHLRSALAGRIRAAVGSPAAAGALGPGCEHVGP